MCDPYALEPNLWLHHVLKELLYSAFIPIKRQLHETHLINILKKATPHWRNIIARQVQKLQWPQSTKQLTIQWSQLMWFQGNVLQAVPLVLTFLRV